MGSAVHMGTGCCSGVPAKDQGLAPAQLRQSATFPDLGPLPLSSNQWCCLSSLPRSAPLWMTCDYAKPTDDPGQSPHFHLTQFLCHIWGHTQFLGLHTVLRSGTWLSLGWGAWPATDSRTGWLHPLWFRENDDKCLGHHDFKLVPAFLAQVNKLAQNPKGQVWPAARLCN